MFEWMSGHGKWYKIKVSYIVSCHVKTNLEPQVELMPQRRPYQLYARNSCRSI